MHHFKINFKTFPALIRGRPARSFVFMDISTSQALLWCFIISLVIILVPVLRTVSKNVRFYFSGLHKLPQPPFPSKNPVNILFRGHGLLKMILKDNPDETALYFSSLSKSLKSSVFVLTGSSLAANVVVLSPSAIRTIARTPAQTYSRPWAIRSFLKSFTGDNSIFVAEGAYHRRLRNAVSAALKHENLVKLSPYFVECGDALAQALGNNTDPDPLLGIRRATFDVIIKACFGQQFISDERLERIMYLYHDALTDQRGFKVLLVLQHIGLQFLPVSSVFSGERSKDMVRKEVHSLCSELIAQRDNDRDFAKEESSEEDVSLLSIICAACDEGQFSTEELVKTVLSFLLAGQATTTIGTAWAFYLLGANEEWQTRVYEEIRSKWNCGDDLALLDDLPLLNRVVKETLRLYPPVQNTIRTTEKEVTIDGYTIPVGTNIRIPFGAIQRHADFWGPDANEFNPDRFIELDNHPDTRWMWSAFWFGTHSCVGQRFAMLEIKAFIATMLSRFHVSVNERRDGKPYRIGTLQSPLNLSLYYEPRQKRS